jgi:hypothetical protein
MPAVSGSASAISVSRYDAFTTIAFPQFLISTVNPNRISSPAGSATV